MWRRFSDHSRVDSPILLLQFIYVELNRICTAFNICIYVRIGVWMDQSEIVDDPSKVVGYSKSNDDHVQLKTAIYLTMISGLINV